MSMTFSKIGAKKMMWNVNDLLPKGGRWVEYLESTGTQYIDTGVNPNFTLSFDVIFSNDGLSGFGNVFGARINSRVNEYQCTLYEDGSIGVGVRNYSLGFYPNVINHIEFNGANEVVVNGVIKTITTSQFSSDPGTILLFCIRNGGNPAQFQSGRIYRCEFGNVRDFRPIAIGNKGYMLDLLTGEYEQYGNKGKGEFVIGPTIAYPERERVSNFLA